MATNTFSMLLTVLFLGAGAATAAPALPTLQAPDPVFKNMPERQTVPFCRHNSFSRSGAGDHMILTVLDPLRTFGSDLLVMFQQFFTDYSDQERHRQAVAVIVVRKRITPSDTVWQAGHKKLCG